MSGPDSVAISARLIVKHPIGDVFDAFCREQIDGIEGLRQARAFPAARRTPGKGGDRLDGSADRATLVFQAVHRHLDKAVPHKLPPGGDAQLRTRADIADKPIR